MCLCVGHTGELCNKRLNWSRCRFEADFCGSVEPYIRWRSRSGESVRRRDGWQYGDAAFCQITLDTWYYRLKEPIVNTLRENGLHAFGNNSAENEPIWMKSGTLWAKCGDWPWQILEAIRAVEAVSEGSIFKKTQNLLKISRSCYFRPS